MMLRKMLVVTVMAAAFALAAEKPAKPQSKPQAKAAPAAAAVTVPSDATQVDANTWRYTDKDGKAWLYRRTPFGLIKMEDKPERAAAPAATDTLKAVEEGDHVNFERASPFGPRRWTKKTANLDEDEKAALARARQKLAATAPAASAPQEK